MLGLIANYFINYNKHSCNYEFLNYGEQCLFKNPAYLKGSSELKNQMLNIKQRSFE